MVRVLIVEDDPMVASINRKYVELTDGFCVCGVCKNGEEALSGLKRFEAELVILDYYMSGMNGDEFLDRMHAAGFHPAVIMVTSASGSATVEALMSRGVMDYLVKPFEFERFQAALFRFQNKRRVLGGENRVMEQGMLDELFSGMPLSHSLPKGMSMQTLDFIRANLGENASREFTVEEIAEQSGLSNVTIRRYLNYLTETGEAVSRIDYKTGGRPALKYRHRPS